MHTRSVFLLVLVLALAAGTVPVAADEPELFPVSQAEGNWPNQDGENVYYDVAPHPDEAVNETLVVPRGFNEMVVYYEHTFHALNLDLRPHFRAADWHPDGEYALVGGGQIFEDETGVYGYSDRSIFAVHRQRGGDVLDVAFNDDGEALATSFSTTPTVSATVLYSSDGEEFEELDTPVETRIRAVEWSPDGDEAVIVGQDGTLMVYQDGEIHDESIEDDPYLRDVAWDEGGDEVLLVGAEGVDTAGIPTGGGVVYEWNDGDARLVSETEDVLNGAAWKPDGEYALVVGGFEGAGTLRSYSDNVTDEMDIQVDRLWGVGWTDGGNALVVGDEEIWRYSYTVSPDDLPPTAQFSVAPENPTTEDTVTLLGFGSTSRGSADRIDRWRFDYGQEDPGWSNSRRVEVRFPEPGEYEVSLAVEDQDGEVSENVTETFVVDEAPDTGTDDGEADTGAGDPDDETEPSPLPGFGALLASLAVALTAVLRYRSQQEA